MSLTVANIPSIINISQKLLTVKELLTAIDYKIDDLYIDKFWDNIQSDKWIYIGENMLEWIGYDSIDEYKLKKRYISLITNHFTETQDYVHLTASEAKDFYVHLGVNIESLPDFNTHNKAKHLIVSPDCFKESLMLIQTDKANQIRKYYLQLEKVFKFYLQYQSQYQAKQLEEEKNKNINLAANAIDYNQLQKREYLYIATNARYASENNFKIGKTLDLKARLSAYNTSHNKREPYYYAFVSEPTYNAKCIEYIIKHILIKFRNSDTNELYIINFKFLEKIVKRICDNYDACIDYYNECIQQELQHMGGAPSTPADIWENKSVAPIQTDKEKMEEFIEYYNDNKSYSYVRYQTENNDTNFRCTHCNHITARLDGIQSHFQRKNKCFDTEHENRRDAIKANELDPVIIQYRDNKNYSYFESYSDEKQCIEFNCVHCKYKSNNIVCLKRHFDRKTKCFEMELKVAPTRNENTKIITLDGKENHTYYRSKGSDGVNVLTCTHCEYQAPDPSRMRRHFKRLAKCWLK